MLKRVFDQESPAPDAVATLISVLETGNDVIRTDAIAALSKYVETGSTDDRIREALLIAVTDEDPDVRCDAMQVLIGIAHDSDTATIRASLIGDPVREVKMAAIQALVQLQDENAINLFTSLVESRNENEVAWEDENDVWDDWLDIQKAVIGALAELGAVDAIPNMLAARNDEYGQNLDVEVFGALSKLGKEGHAALLDIAKKEPGAARKRAFVTLANADAVLLESQLQFLLDDEFSEVRMLALPFIDPTSQTAVNIALADPDPAVRKEALARFTPEYPKLAISALSDSDETVKAAALDLLTLPIPAKLAEALVSNIEVWLQKCGPVLTTTSAKLLPQLCGLQAVDPLLNLARNEERPLEARVAAVDALGKIEDPASTERMIDFLGNPSRQVRTVALTYLAQFAKNGDEKSTEALALAIDGILLAPDKAIIHRDDAKQNDAVDMATPKTDMPLGGSTLRITPDGNVVEVEEDIADTSISTLAAIQADQQKSTSDFEASQLAEDTPEESGPKRRKRRAVEGPVEISTDLTMVALNVGADVPDADISAAIIGALQSEHEDIRGQAYNSLLRRAKILPETLDQEKYIDIIVDALATEAPYIRSIAAEIASNMPLPAIQTKLPQTAVLLDDDDPAVRALAARFEENLDVLGKCLSDPSEIVRRPALDKLLKASSQYALTDVWERILACDRVDTVSTAIDMEPAIHQHVLNCLSEENTPSRKAHILLQAMAA